MGYHADGSGTIHFSRKLEEPEIHTLIELMQDECVEGEFDKNDDTACFSLWFENTHYHDDTFMELLVTIAEVLPVNGGCIECSGEDKCFWRFIFENGKWIEQDGEIVFPDVKPKPVYVYHEYNDELPYGEELIRVYEDKEDAEAFLASQVLKAYGLTLDQMRSDHEFANDVIRNDYVSIANDGGDVSFFVVTKRKMVEKGEKE